MHIRTAFIADLDQIYGCAQRFFEYAKFDKWGLTLDEDSFKECIGKCISDKNGIVLLLMDGQTVAGGICGFIAPFGFNKTIQICNEVFWWVDEQYRGRDSIKLLAEYESIAKLMGATVIMMVAVETHLRPAVEKIYEKRGYLKLEGQYAKSV